MSLTAMLRSERRLNVVCRRQATRSRPIRRPSICWIACRTKLNSDASINPLAGSAEREPIAADAMNQSRSKPFSKYLWLWMPAFAGMTGESFRTIYRRYRRCCH